MIDELFLHAPVSETVLVFFRYSYSRSRGLFGGVSIEGSVIVERQDANVIAYDSQVTARLLLGGTIPPPPWATPLIKALESCTGLPGNRTWVRDEENRTPGGSYAFGGQSSPGGGPHTPGGGRSSPSFLRRKKKDSPPPFPPETWGEETSTGSYFTESAPQSHSRNMTWGGPVARSNLSASGTTSNLFETPFESDFNFDKPAASSLKKSSNPFLSSIGKTSNRSPSYNFTPPTNQTPSSTLPPHKRYNSLGNFTYPKHESLLGDEFNSSDAYSPPIPAQMPLNSGKPFLKTREELSRPLSPQEGVARAVALFNFSAVEDGDLSFDKGDVIVITKKSYSADDWYVQ